MGRLLFYTTLTATLKQRRLNSRPHGNISYFNLLATAFGLYANPKVLNRNSQAS